ncbi:MAG: TatD family hydrolase [Thermofilaceae archaeon]
MTHRYTDSHCHIHEFGEAELESFGDSFEMIVGVADDVESSLRTLELAKKFRYIVPCAGLHPWSLREVNLEEQLKGLEKLAASGEVRCIGEVGLDLAFVPDTYEQQLAVFRCVLQIAKDHDLPVNLHTAKAWRQVLEEVVRFGIKRALFHWFTGPLDVLSEIVARGYLISINPTVKISDKHRSIAKRAPLSSITFESDGPYEYRGLHLTPSMIPEVVAIIAEERGLAADELTEVSRENLLRLLL